MFNCYLSVLVSKVLNHKDTTEPKISI